MELKRPQVVGIANAWTFDIALDIRFVIAAGDNQKDITNCPSFDSDGTLELLLLQSLNFPASADAQVGVFFMIPILGRPRGGAATT